MPDCTVVILAGGQGSRLRRLGRFVSKASLIAYDQPLLLRHLDHLIEAGLRRVIVSTNPLHYPLIDLMLTNYRASVEREGITDADITLLNNPMHTVGPTEALLYAAERVGTRRTLIVLVDEFIRGNSFPQYVAHVDDSDDYGGIAELVDALETKRGGYVTVVDGCIVSYTEQAGILDAQGSPSTGNTLVTTAELVEDCQRFIAAAPGAGSIGDFFDYRVQTLGRVVRALTEPDFININTPDYLLLANLYAAMEHHAPDTAIHTQLAQLAALMRTTLHENI